MPTEEIKKAIIEDLKKAVIEYDEDLSRDASNRALAEGVDAYEAVMEGLAAGMEVVGKLFDQQEYFVPEVLMCADALYAGLEILKPHIRQEDRARIKGQVVIGVVQGDVHDIGKNLVKMMFEVAGFTVHDLGVDVPLEKFVEEQLRTDSDILCLSAMMTTTMMGMKGVIDGVKQKNPHVKVLVGGAPLTPEVAQKLGADGYSDNATNAVTEAINMVASLRRM
ncbi:MAG: cobalamin-dependent protein [Chloroflexi bacterium]|nr:cobalamin-dependent protein [Chloroflexota bacterium]